MPNRDPRKLVSPGDPFEISAANFNRWQRAAEAAENSGQVGGDTRSTPEASARTVLAKNTTAQALKVGSLVGLAVQLIRPSNDNPSPQMVFTASTPRSEYYGGGWGVLAEPMNKGDALVRVYVAGMFPARVRLAKGPSLLNFQAGSVDRETTDQAEADIDDYLLQVQASGQFRVVWFDGYPADDDEDADPLIRWAIVTPITPLPRATGKFQYLGVTDDLRIPHFGPTFIEG